MDVSYCKSMAELGEYEAGRRWLDKNENTKKPVKDSRVAAFVCICISVCLLALPPVKFEFSCNFYNCCKSPATAECIRMWQQAAACEAATVRQLAICINLD